MATPNILLTQVRAFVTVARTGSFTKAAEALGYTEPAIHIQVTALRRAVGGALFERARGQMRLTPLGQALLPFAERAITEIDAMMERTQQLTAQRGRTLRVGVGRFSGSYVFPALAALFREQHPELDLVVRVMPLDAVVTEIAEGTLDVGFGGALNAYLPTMPAHLERPLLVPWAPFERVLCGTPASVARIAAGPPGDITVYVPLNAPLRRPYIVDSLRAAGHEPHFETVADSEAAKTAAQTGLSLAASPWFAARNELALGYLVEYRPPLPDSREWISVAHRRPASNPSIATFIGFLRHARTVPRIRAMLIRDQFLSSLSNGALARHA